MSFNGTKTPVKPTDQSKVRFPVPMRPNAKFPQVMEYYLTPELEAKFVELFPITMNPQLMEWFGISFSTIQRFKRELGLAKDRAVILKKHAAQVKAICRKNGYYKSIKGKQPSEQCREAARRLRADGFHPMRRLKEINPRKYRAVLRRKSRQRKELIAKERRRYDIGLLPLSDISPSLYAGVKYNKYQVHVRRRMKQLGYVPGSANPEFGERMFLYYKKDTQRHPIAEKNAVEGGFEFRPIESRGKVLNTISIVKHNGFGEE